MHGDDVHVPLAENEVVCLRILGVVQRKQVVALLEHIGFGAVEVFRRRVGSKRPTAEGDDIAARVENREHHTVDELVVNAVVVAHQ